MNIPPVGFGFVRKDLTFALRKLDVGEYKEFPLERRNAIHSAANHAGIKIATRQMGQEDTFRCYRTD